MAKPGDPCPDCGAPLLPGLQLSELHEPGTWCHPCALNGLEALSKKWEDEEHEKLN
jgi:hypothetical protein